MSLKRIVLVLAGSLLVVCLAACAPLPVATPPSAATSAAPAQQAASAATPTSEPAPTPAIPDPKTDPTAALLYAGNAQLFKTAEFTYTMTMNMAPADDASTKALGTQAALLKGLAMGANGSGAFEVTDPAAQKQKMRMDMDLNAAGQKMTMQMVLIDQTGWVKASGQDKWQKVEGDQAKSLAPGVNPEQMLKDLEDAVDVQWIEDVTVDGEQLSHLRFTMDPAKMDLSSLTSSATSAANLTPEQIAAMVKDMKPVVDVWLAKPSLELRGEKMQLGWVMPLPEAGDLKDVKLAVDMLMDMRFSNVNQPVTIQPPAE